MSHWLRVELAWMGTRHASADYPPATPDTDGAARFYDDGGVPRRVEWFIEDARAKNPDTFSLTPVDPLVEAVARVAKAIAEVQR